MGDVLNRRVKLSARDVGLVKAVARLGSHRRAGGKAIVALIVTVKRTRERAPAVAGRKAVVVINSKCLGMGQDIFGSCERVAELRCMWLVVLLPEGTVAQVEVPGGFSIDSTESRASCVQRP